VKRPGIAVLIGLCWIAPEILLAGIIGSPHDFTAQTWNISASDPDGACSVCHAPHQSTSDGAPIWNHTTTRSAFVMYNTNTVPGSKMKAAPQTTPGQGSLACLSCHDGTVAINSYGGGIQGGAAVMITNTALISADLTHTHPISFVYDSALATADGFLQDPSAPVLIPESGAFNSGPDITIRGLLLNGGNRLECSACHDVHNQIGAPYDATTNPKLLKIVGSRSGIGSLLCRSCHLE
jgi:hypothetical protein